ncbi:MAG: hypothetical protein PVJ02_07725 [Gemmatimonadota bacterium]|jgi:hypothetical protein
MDRPIRSSGRALLGAVALALAALVLPLRPLAAQGTGTGSKVRVGVTFGGISTVGLSLEFVNENTSFDFTVGTWSFRDLSVSAVVRQYFGTGNLLPFVGGGLWMVLASPPGDGGQTGFAAVLHAPVGLDWQAVDDHYLGIDMAVNRALWVRRTDPEDDLPLNKRLVPLPGVYYRWGH